MNKPSKFHKIWYDPETETYHIGETILDNSMVEMLKDWNVEGSEKAEGIRNVLLDMFTHDAVMSGMREITESPIVFLQQIKHYTDVLIHFNKVRERVIQNEKS